jgi:hypothetical protein
MEHASVAALARMTMQLMALSAPADLVQATIDAMSDEVQHARLCYGVASARLGRTLGPGPLATADAVAHPDDVASIVADLVTEGCLGETTAAALARAGASRTEPQCREILERIAADETRHAALAFRTLAWLCAHPRHGEVARCTLRAELHNLELAPAPDAPTAIGVPKTEMPRLLTAVRDATVLPLLRHVGAVV